MKKLNIEAPVRLPYFDWDKAKHFYYVAKLGSVSEASRFLNLSQPSLSKKISILENHLKCKLFVRTAKGLELTRKGSELFAIIEKTFISLKGFSYSAAVAASEGKKRNIRISTTHAVASYVLNEHLLDYNELHPDIIFEIVADDQTVDILINDVDIVVKPFETHIKGVDQQPLFTLERKLFASQSYLEKFGMPQKIEDLKNHRLLAFSHPKHLQSLPYADVLWILKLGMPANEIREPVFTSNSVECLIEAAKKGVGIIASYPQMNLVRRAHLVNILPELKDRPVMWHFSCLQSSSSDKYLKDIRKFLQHRLSQL